jgi:hypothetical protein
VGALLKWVAQALAACGIIGAAAACSSPSPTVRPSATAPTISAAGDASVKRCIDANSRRLIGDAATVDNDASLIDNAVAACEAASASLRSEGLLKTSLYSDIDDQVRRAQALASKIHKGKASHEDGVLFDQATVPWALKALVELGALRP